MEGSSVIAGNADGAAENCSSGGGRPPIPTTLGGRGAYRHCLVSGGTPPLSAKSLVRHSSLVIGVEIRLISYFFFCLIQIKVITCESNHGFGYS